MAVNNSLTPKMREVNEYEPQASRESGVSNATAVAMAREAKALEIAMISAKRDPRDITRVEDSIARACSRLGLARKAEYSFSRAGQSITGASINLMKVVATCYGNIEYGVNEVQRYEDYSECEAYAWDFENNVRTARKFTVPHFRDTKQGKVRIAEDRDIREMVMNFGSRNVRSCLESIIPADLIDEAREICQKTLNGSGQSLEEMKSFAKKTFRDKWGINSETLEALIGVKYDLWTKAEYNMACKYNTALEEKETTVAALREKASKNNVKKSNPPSATESKGKEKSNDPVSEEEWDRLSKKHNVALKQQSLDESDPLA